MSATSTRGFPPVLMSEKSRQCVSFALILLSLLLCQMGLALLALSFYVRPYLQQHHLVTGQRANSDLFPYGLIVASGATLVSSCLAVMSGVSARQRRRSGRSAAVQFGYFYLLAEFATAAYMLALGVVFIVQVDAFEAAYQRGFSRAMWQYMQNRQLKEYIDGVQQEFGCCGGHGYSDWFVVDWYPRDLYQRRYKDAAKQRNQLAKKNHGLLLGLLLKAVLPLLADRPADQTFLSKDKYSNSTALIESFSIGAYGTEAHREQVVMAMDYEFERGEYTSALLHVKSEVGFSEVPHSCCDPSAPTWCHQRYSNYPWYSYDPAKRLSIHHVGCAYKVKAFLSGTVTWLVAVLFCTMSLKFILMILYRYVQTSMLTGLAAGRHLSPSLGYLVPLPADGGGTGDTEQQPLLASEDGDDTADSDITTGDETTEEDTADREEEDDEEGSGA